MTPHEAWEGFVGAQTPAEFMRISKSKGLDTVETALGGYVNDWPHDVAPTQEITSALIGHIQDSIQPVVIALLYSLNDYDGDNVWEDVIRPTAGEWLDEESSHLIDPAYMSDSFALYGGITFYHNSSNGNWYVSHS